MFPCVLQCLDTPEEAMVVYHYANRSYISQTMFVDLCPALLAMMDRTLCFPHTTLINSHEGHNHDDDHTGHDHDDDHTGHDHSGHDHSGHDHSGHGHEAVTDGVKLARSVEHIPGRRYVYIVKWSIK